MYPVTHRVLLPQAHQIERAIGAANAISSRIWRRCFAISRKERIWSPCTYSHMTPPINDPPGTPMTRISPAESSCAWERRTTSIVKGFSPSRISSSYRSPDNLKPHLPSSIPDAGIVAIIVKPQTTLKNTPTFIPVSSDESEPNNSTEGQQALPPKKKSNFFLSGISNEDDSLPPRSALTWFKNLRFQTHSVKSSLLSKTKAHPGSFCCQPRVSLIMIKDAANLSAITTPSPSFQLSRRLPSPPCLASRRLQTSPVKAVILSLEPNEEG